MPPVCEERGPWLTSRKTDCECLVAARAGSTRHRDRVSVSVTSTEVAMDPFCERPARSLPPQKRFVRTLILW